MDETIAHWIPDEELEYDQEGNWVTSHDARLVMESDGELEDMYVNVRPYLKQWVNALKSMYQIVVLTASTQDYADTILDYIDPNFELFEGRFYRENWVWTKDEVYIKDLTLFTKKWDLKDIVLVDNSAHCFGLQINNGYPIRSFTTDKQDREFYNLTQFLKVLYYFDDFREVLAKTFVLQKFITLKVTDEVKR